jgi:hypothetical protein
LVDANGPGPFLSLEEVQAPGTVAEASALVMSDSRTTRFERFTLDNLLSEVTRWWETGLSIFQQELAELHQPNAPPTLPAET